MVRKTLYVAIPYLIGFICCSRIYEDNLLLIFLILAFLGTVLLIKVFKFKFKQSVLCGTSFIMGFLVYSNYMVTTQNYIEQFSNQEILFTGKVIELNDYESDTSSYVIDGIINNNIKSKIYVYTNTIDCSYGDTLSFECTAIKFNNDYLFNSKDYYNSKGIYLETYSISNIKVIKNFDLKSKLIRKLNYYRDKTISTFKSKMSKDSSSMLTAILFGDKSDLSKNDKDALNRSGISHMVAVSGLHLAILTSILEFFLKRIDKHFEIPKLLNFLIYEIFSITFVALVGFPISAVRTLIMLSISKSATLFARQADTLNTLSLTALVMVTIEPYLISNSSFLLSISGVFGIGVFSNYILKDLNYNSFIKGILSTILTTICIFPVAIMFFDEVSIMSPLSNIVCFPLCEISLISGFLVFLFNGRLLLISKTLLYLSDFSCQLIVSFCRIVSKMPIGNVPTGYNALKYVVIATVIISLICYGTFKDRMLLLKTITLGIVSVLIVTFAVKSYDNNKIKVAILGKSNYQVMVISYNDDVHILDFSKNYKTTNYVQKYCKRFGINKVSSISFLKKSYQTMAMYDTLLNNIQVDKINVPNGTYFLERQSILSNFPIYMDTQNSQYIYDYGEFSVTVHTNNFFEITINGQTQTFLTDEYNIIFESNLNGFFNVRDLKL